jgi:polysaccharide export outer membrane protein
MKSLVMKSSIATAAAFTLIVSPLIAQQYQGQTKAGAQPYSEGSNLPVQPLGRNDLIGLQVYDSPELTRTYRVSADGTIHLPMVKRRINALGLLPTDLETSVADALMKEHIMTQPIVTVSVVEYQSRPIHVVGAFKAPLTFEATPPVTLLDAISRADGMAENAGPEILVTHTETTADGHTTKLTQRITVADLMQNTDPALNLELHGGEEIRLPEAGRIYVVGNVKKPGEYLIKSSTESSVLKALSLSEGLETYTGDTAYIYRKDAGPAGVNEIPVDLKKILDRKSPDIALLPNDILYIADNKRKKTTMAALEKIFLVGTGVSAAAIYALTR